MDRFPEILAYNLILGVLTIALLFLLWRRRNHFHWNRILLLATLLGCSAFLGALILPVGRFCKVQLLTWAVFLHGPAFFFGAGSILRKSKRRLAGASFLGALALSAIGLDAFFVEPQWLEISRHTILSAKAASPLRVAVVADLQTDRPGNYERRALEKVREAEPDLVLFAGDYIHIHEEPENSEGRRRLRDVLKGVDLDAPMGAYAVRGNCDWPGVWKDVFEGLPVEAIEETTTLDLGPTVLTCLSERDSDDVSLFVERQDRFHIILGHRPDFALGENQADLLVAGHTHGGQVRLPILGPLLTLSEVPRKWAAGLHEIAPEKRLLVSRGVGMERINAPRLRFLCRPEIVIVDILPLDDR